MKIQDFNERLKDSILIADGAMGSMLHETVGTQRCFDELNSTEPEAVFRVHQAYIEAGAQIIETNTFNSTSISQADYATAALVPELNYRAARLARHAADEYASRGGGPRFVAGALGPTNRMTSM